MVGVRVDAVGEAVGDSWMGDVVVRTLSDAAVPVCRSLTPPQAASMPARTTPEMSFVPDIGLDTAPPDLADVEDCQQIAPLDGH